MRRLLIYTSTPSTGFLDDDSDGGRQKRDESSNEKSNEAGADFRPAPKFERMQFARIDGVSSGHRNHNRVIHASFTCISSVDKIAYELSDLISLGTVTITSRVTLRAN